MIWLRVKVHSNRIIADLHYIVREVSEGYELIAGERRLMAAKANNHATIPAKILNLSDRDARVLALSENLQRENLNIYEETVAIMGLLSASLGIESFDEIKSLIASSRNELRRHKHGWNTSIPLDPGVNIIREVIAANLKGMSVGSFQSNRLPLLDLPTDVIIAIDRGLSYMKALAIAKVDDIEARADLIKTVIDDDFNLSEVKKLIKGLDEKPQLETDTKTTTIDLTPQKTRLASVLRQVKTTKDFSRVEEMDLLLDQMEALLSMT